MSSFLRQKLETVSWKVEGGWMVGVFIFSACHQELS